MVSVMLIIKVKVSVKPALKIVQLDIMNTVLFVNNVKFRNYLHIHV